MHRLNDHFCSGDNGWIERRSAPRHIDGKSGKVDDCAIAAIAAQVVRRPHKDAVHGTGLNAQRTKHALRVVDRKATDLEAFPTLNPLFPDVDAVDRTRLRTLVAGDAGRQVEPMEAPVAGRHGNRQFGVLKLLSERLSIPIVGAAEDSQRHEKTFRDRRNRRKHVAKPNPHCMATVIVWRP